MAVSVEIGKPGAGKTLVSLQLYILPALLAGRHIFHNIPGLNCVKISYYLRNKYNRKDITPYYVENLLHDYSIEHLLENWKTYFPKRTTVPTENDLGAYYLNAIPKAPQGALIILDEAQKKCYINSKNWKEERNRKFFEYCSVHRKSKHEVLIITQDDDNIDSSVNGIREELIFLMRQERLGLKNRVQLRYFLGHQSIKNTPYATSGVNYDKAIFDLYQSYAPNLAGNIKEIRKTKFFLNNAKFIAFAVAGVVLFSCGAPKTMKLFNGTAFKHETPLVSSSSASSSSFSLGEFEEYYCGDKFYVLRSGGKVDTLEPKTIPPNYCPKFNYNFRRVPK